MKKLYTIILLAVIVSGAKQSHAQGTWTQKANLSGTARQSAAGFSIGTKGYICTGFDLNYALQTDLWEWNQSTNAWTQKANFPGTGRMGAVGFSIGTKGYIGTGYNSSGNGTYFADFWEWNQATNAWVQKTGLGSTVREYAVGFTIGSKGYIGTGQYSSGFTLMFRNDLWEYNQSTGAWTQKANFPGAARCGAAAFVVNNIAYIGAGEAYPTPYYDFYAFDPSSNSWTQKTSFSGAPYRYAVGFAIGSKGYYGTGTDGQLFGSGSFWEYDPGADTWTQVASLPGTNSVYRFDAVAFVIAGKGYVGTGKNYNADGLNDFYEYTSPESGINETDLSNTISVFPNPSSGKLTLNSEFAKGEIAIYNLQGEKVFQSEIKNQKTEIDLSKQPSGVYFLQLKTSEGVANKKIIIYK